MLHHLRIAVTALSLTACVLLIALWVRSYWWIDTVAEWQGKPISTMNGRLFFEATFIQVESSGAYTSCRFFPGTSMSIRNHGLPLRPAVTGIPFWLLSLGAAVVAASPWLPWSRRFSLRAMLIATTLVAVVLGIVVAAQ